MQVLVKLLEIQGCLKNLKASIEIEDFDSANELALQFDSVLKESIQDKDLIEKDLHLVLEDFSQLVSNLQEKQKLVGKNIVKLKRNSNHINKYLQAK